MSKRRILLMYISEVSGHHQATKAIENALKILDPKISILNINGFHYTNPISEKIVNRLYMGVIKRTPKIWDYLYDNSKVVKGLQRWKRLLHRLNSPKLKNLYDDFRPQVIACSQAFPCGMVADFRERYNLSIPLVAVVTDYIVHSFWLYPTVDFYITADEASKNRLIDKGILPQRIKVLGIPVDPKFTERVDKERVYKRFNLDMSLPAILVMGGGQGLGPIRKIVKYLNRVENQFQIIIICGKNKKLFKELKRNILSYRKKTIVLGFIENVYEIMSISDILITKPGGITTAEALSKGLPMIIVKPIPGQEAQNTSYLVRKKIAVKIEKENQIPSLIEELLINPNLIKDIRSKALRIARPNSSFEIAKLLLSLCES